MGGKGSKNKKLTKEDLDFLLGNTNFNKRQIKQWYKGFMVGILQCILGILDEFIKKQSNEKDNWGLCGMFTIALRAPEDGQWSYLFF